MPRPKSNPVDRALADVNRRLETVERKLRHEEVSPTPVIPAAGPLCQVRNFLKELLTPPPKTAPRTSREIPDVAVDPMHDLEADAIPFARRPEPDLFTHAQAAGPSVPDDRLGRLLAAGSFRPPKPTLKRVQRETRNRFFMWLGLSFVALWLIYAVVR